MSVMSREDTPWDDGIIVPFSSSNSTHSKFTNGSRPHRPLSLMLRFLTPHMMCYMKGTSKTFHPPSPSTSLSNLKLLKMYVSELPVPPRRLSHISPFSKNFVASSHGATKICPALTPILLYTKSRRTWVPKPSGPPP
jgi:hypothetical protein